MTPSLSLIQHVVAETFNVTPDRIVGWSKKRVDVYPRFAVCGMAREFTGKSFREIADFLSCRDHTSICYANARYERLMLKDREFSTTVANARRVLKEAGYIDAIFNDLKFIRHSPQKSAQVEMQA